MSVKISVVIPTYNRVDKLREVLPTLLNQTMHPDDYEILLCDAGSTDGTAEYVQSLNAPNLRLLVGPNTGRSGARNRGIDNAQGETVHSFVTPFTHASYSSGVLLTNSPQSCKSLV